ncbi:MAG: cob(I)yrinic acid a,c-diamide adenosyltransferase [bacterium]
MLYTRKGDNGTTKTFGCDQRLSKSSIIAEALGSLDEINSFLGLLKLKAGDSVWSLPEQELNVAETVNRIQQDLFIVQAELAGAEKTIVEDKVKWLESIVDGIEKTLPPITTFFVSGGTELAALSDVCRTIVRRAERRVVAVQEEGTRSVGEFTRAYLNRLSSVFYAFAREANHVAGIVEESPKYK